MLLKERKIPNNLQLRRYLKPRIAFTEGQLKKLLTDEKGFEGECKFDELIARSPASTYLQLNDLFLEWRNTTFQIDSSLITPHKVYLFDVKNYEGEFYIEGNRWYYSSGYEIKNPILQLQRSESLLTPLIQSLGINLPIESKIVFVNPNFTLFQANRLLPIILPTQVNSLLKSFGSVSMKSSGHLVKSAKELALLHNDKTPFDNMHIPEYAYESLNKGVSCCGCGSLAVHVNGRVLMCKRCRAIEKLHTGIMRTVEEHRVLFPKRFLTVSEAIEWCRLDLNKLRMQKILKEHLVMVEGGKSTYYRFE
ncbi:nuclease-related domain-containing protein [Bacillus sinesaloumensis]|uniref:nuclease-related domain-containing protein n=1 Tax=Litchfieldia sinesaloumensis TaxID=1926280 RepID=UPI0009889420|nr:NERD domain-containing protein [Bacillus sinesaloumensis]